MTKDEATQAKCPVCGSPSLKVGAEVSSQFAPVRHGVPMLSLDESRPVDPDDPAERARLGIR